MASTTDWSPLILCGVTAAAAIGTLAVVRRSSALPNPARGPIFTCARCGELKHTEGKDGDNFRWVSARTKNGQRVLSVRPGNTRVCIPCYDQLTIEEMIKAGQTQTMDLQKGARGSWAVETNYGRIRFVARDVLRHRRNNRDITDFDFMGPDAKLWHGTAYHDGDDTSVPAHVWRHRPGQDPLRQKDAK